jgi:hypothetical protein
MFLVFVAEVQTEAGVLECKARLRQQRGSAHKFNDLRSEFAPPARLRCQDHQRLGHGGFVPPITGGVGEQQPTLIACGTPFRDLWFLAESVAGLAGDEEGKWKKQ